MQMWSTERILLLLNLLSPACANPQYTAHFRGVQTGPYHIYNCGSHTSTISSLINVLNATLDHAIQDVSQMGSSSAFTAFFKNIAVASTVRGILLDIVKGTPIAPGPHALQNASPDDFGPPLTPQILCVTGYHQLTWSTAAGGFGGEQFDAYTACQQSPVHSFGVFGSKYQSNSIVLCPAFWTYTAIPTPSKADCMKVDPHFDRFRDSGKRLVNFQLWVLLHELAHCYVYARSGSLSEVSTANDCASLSADSAVDNAQNYVFYAASIRQGCTDFPRGTRPGHGRSGSVPIQYGSVELLEIDANTTLSGGSASQNGSTYGGQSISNSSTGTSAALPKIVVPSRWPT